MTRYEETASGCELDLSDNTNLWGAPPSAAAVLAKAQSFSRYPSAYSTGLKGALARYVGVDVSLVFTGCGSDDVLDSAIRACGSPGDTLSVIEPTFSMIPLFAKASGVSVVRIDGNAGDVREAIGSAGATLVYLCTPNNPTGGVLDRALVESVVEEARGIVIVDEAYAEFAGESLVDLVARYDNLIVTRTMSKAFGLAGLRVGYGVASPATVARVEAARGPYKVSAAGELVAIEVLENDLDWVRARVGDAVINRKRMVEALALAGFRPLDSEANFVLLPVEDAAFVETGLRMRGIAVRRFDALAGIGDAVRITIGPWNMMERCLAALRETLA